MSSASRNFNVLRRFAAERAPRLTLSNQSILLLTFGVSALVQLTIGWILLFRTSASALELDEQEYWNLSGQILTGSPIDVGRRTLLHPLVIAGFRSIYDNVWFVQCGMALLAASAPPFLALVVYKTTRSKPSALLAGLTLALWPPQIFYASSLYSETLALPIFLAFLLVLPIEYHVPAKIGPLRWIAAGALLGVAAQVRPMYQLFLPFVALTVWLDIRRTIPALVRFSLVLAGFAIVVLPWSIYVSRELKHPVILTANGGETLAGGFTPKLLTMSDQFTRLPNRTTWSGPGKWLPISQNGYLSAREQLLPYAEQDHLLRGRAMAWVKSDPADAAYLGVRKLTYMWGIYPFKLNGWIQAIFGNLPTILLTFIFAFALIEDGQIRRRCSRLFLLPVFVSGVALISWGSWRFRLPADAGMIGIAATFILTKMKLKSGGETSLDGVPCTTG